MPVRPLDGFVMPVNQRVLVTVIETSLSGDWVFVVKDCVESYFYGFRTGVFL
jgi:hypothetical protein